MSHHDFIEELRWRDRLAQITDEPGLRTHLSTPGRRAYIGYDPTADSLTIGNMVTIMLLAHFQRAGHTPVVLAGGGTGMIGDPSGKSAERMLLTKDQVAHNVQRQQRIYERLLDFSPGLSNRATIVNNADWLSPISYLDALRDIGKYFSVNAMMQKDSVRERLTNRDQGISYTEFSYMILQSYDYLHLHRAAGITVQMGGSDQWGNITAGIDLIRRVHAREAGDEAAPPQAFGLTTPLITKSDGSKFGKSESGAIWMTADRTSPYAFYQFWLNAEDSEVMKFIKTFTFFPRERVEELAATHAANPGAREAHKALAREVTRLLHGASACEQAQRASEALFSGQVSDLPYELLEEVFANVPASDHGKARLAAPGLPLLDTLVETGLAQSKREGREFLQSGAVTINGRKASLDERLTTADLLHGRIIALRRGKKNWHITRWA
jgi:tyrosyl-tRNA synthetase